MADARTHSPLSLVSVREALAAPSLAGARVLAGKAGLRRVVSSVTVGEVPDIADFLAGGELILSTLFAVAADPAARFAFVEGLIDKKAAALVTKPGRFLGELDDAIIELAERRRFPVITVSDDVRWTDVVRDTYEIALGRRVTELEHLAATQRELVRVAVEGGGYEHLADTTARLLDRPVAVADSVGRLLAVSPPGADVPLAPMTDIARAVGAGETLVQVPADDAAGIQAAATAPVVAGGVVLGAIGTTASTPLSPLDYSALAQAATVAAILIGREQVRLETELRLRGDLLAEIETSSAADAADLVGKASLFGCDVSTGAVVMAIRVDPKATAGAGISELERALAAYVLEHHRNTLVATRGPVTFALLGIPRGADPDRFFGRCEKIAERMAGRLAAQWAGGAHAVALGRPHDPGSLREALREAQVAIDVAARLGRQGGFLRYDDVGSYKLLLSLADSNPDELRRFVADTVGPLDASGGELRETLKAYLETDGNIAEVASRLFMHRHTVRYRLDRIAKLAGLDPRTSEGREQLSLGMKAARLLQTLR